ncbi:hypothetical protein [Pseudactinotalea sp.]|uniref:hypothetical protein n=1 Tax=Pseudactinotalea sp. TaxID=1926260 RepID=UPI003B3B4D6C
MGWWDKLRKKDDGAGPAGEPAGPSPLTDADRAAIVQQVQREFAQMGREVVADGQGGLRGMDGRAFGTGNLEAQLERLPRDRWHELIANHVRIMDSTIDAPGPGSLAEVRDRLYLRLRAASALPQAPDYDSPVLPGIIGMVTIDHPEHTEELGGLSGLGTWDEIRPIALENIRALPPMRHDPVAADSERTEAVVHVFVTDDFFGPSRFLALDQLLEQIGSTGQAPGLLVAIPHRHMIAIHEVAGQGTLAAMNGMVNLANGQFSSNPGAITPEVFYVAADGHSQQVTHRSDGSVTVRIDGAIAEAFTALGLIGG